MGKRSTTSHQGFIFENEMGDSFGSNKRLRVSSPADYAALTLLSLKREAVKFETTLPMTTVRMPTTISISSQPSALSSKSCASSVCCSVTDDECSVTTATTTCSPPAAAVPPTTTVATPAKAPLRKPILCHLNQTKAAVPKQTSGACTFECRPLQPPPRLPNFLVLSSYAPFAVPRKQESKQ